MKFKVMTAIFALALVAGAATLALAPRPGPVSAASGGNVEATFTKWMDHGTGTGVVGGNVGEGDFAWHVVSSDLTSRPGFWLGVAVYEFHDAAANFFSLTVDVVENLATGNAKFTGEVTGEWLKGADVTGGFRTISCTEAPNGTCFKGTIHIDAGSAD
jgi:hypothetical protein